jgi:hypothetical protein
MEIIKEYWELYKRRLRDTILKEEFSGIRRIEVQI